MKRQRGAALGIVVLLIALAALAWFFWPELSSWRRAPPAEPRAITPRGDLASDEQNTIAIFENASPSVAFITTSRRVIDLFARRALDIPQGSGSGFIWDDAGHVVTNFHVIAGAERATVRLTGERDFDAVLVGASPEHDLAVLRIELGQAVAPPLPVGASADLKVGQKVFAIGNPFGLDHSLSTGVISALGRTIDSPDQREIRGVIQTDAAINPGNSGGPLLDSSGRLIGINTAIYSASGTSAGVGFAVPVDTINRVVPQLIAEGRYVRPILGVQTDDTIAKQLLDEVGLEGVPVLRVAPGTPAAKAGFKAAEFSENGDLMLGDVIRSIDGEDVENLNDLTAALDEKKAGDTVTVVVWRGGQERTVQVPLTP